VSATPATSWYADANEWKSGTDTSGGGTPPPPSTMTVGIDITINTSGPPLSSQYAKAVAQFGSCGPFTKFFDGGAGPSAAVANLVNSGYGSQPDELCPIICFKRLNSSDITFLTHYFAGLTAKVGICWWQEPEDDVAKGNTTVAAYRAAITQIDELRQASPNPDLIDLIPCLMNYQEVDAKNTIWSELLTGLPINSFGTDIYDSYSMPSTWTPSAKAGWAVGASKTLGVPWRSTETGFQVSTKSSGDTVAAAVARMQSYIAYAQANGCISMNYWNDPPWNNATIMAAWGAAM
jgi:hypothetical protein